MGAGETLEMTPAIHQVVGRSADIQRATSVGKATMGHEFSTSSKCCRERYAFTICAPTSARDGSICTPSQQFFQSGSVSA